MPLHPRVLCVDDEPDMLSSLKAQLRGRFEVLIATGGEAGLAVLAENPDIAVVISDMSMPGMGGVEFLGKVRLQAPDAVRVLLTGQADLFSTIGAVNEGQIFRFLTKPCSVKALGVAVNDAVTQHQLVAAERVLLEQTLSGSIATLIEALSLVSPLAFGRATRLKELVAGLVLALDMREWWEVEVAAMLSQLAWITLPEEVVEKSYYGHPLLRQEAEMVERLPVVTEKLLGHIPRLELVREIVVGASITAPRTPRLEPEQAKMASRGAEILRIAMDFDQLMARGTEPGPALSILAGREARYEDDVLAALASLRGRPRTSEDLRELPLAAVHSGMILLDDVVLRSGMLLVCRGTAITPGLLERIRNLPRGSVNEPIRVRVPPKP